jgi:hypothetical protein
MKVIKRVNLEIVAVITVAIVVISTMLPACEITGEMTLGGCKPCKYTGQLSCGVAPTYTSCEFVRVMCIGVDDRYGCYNISWSLCNSVARCVPGDNQACY